MTRKNGTWNRRAGGLAIALLVGGCAGGGTPAVGEQQAALDDDDLKEKGAFTCELTVGPELSPAIAATEIDRDRMLMSHPGMRQKMLPIAFGDGPNLLMGGRYLFRTEQQAIDYADFVLHRYVLDGVQFVDRVYFKDHDCRAFRTIGAHDFADFRTSQLVVRTERWQVSDDANGVEGLLNQRWPDVRAAAAAAGLTSVWLLWNDDERKVQLVYFADRVAPPDPEVPDFASLGALAGAPPLGAIFDDQPAFTRELDRTHWVFNIWQPFVLGDQGAPSLFPYSPPFPNISCGDGLCTPSHGEDGQTCAADCRPRCGDAVCQPEDGEDVHGCPSDCRVPSSPIQ
jgi:hypothetical protein